MSIRIPIVSEFNSKGIDKAIKEFKSLEGAGKKAQFALKKAALPAIAALGALAVAGGHALKAGEAAATANARIAQINESMGLFGEQTDNVNKKLIKYAETVARQTGVDQNSIKATQAKLLTFGELAKSADEIGGAFDRATKAAIDMAAAGFGEASANAVQLGKALNDPIKGIAALAKSGVTFTEQEKDKIRVLVESNQLLKAQEMVLAAIEKQVGGTAEATANDSDKMKIAFSQLSEKLGLMLLPALSKVTEMALKFTDWASRNTTTLLIVAGAVGTIASTILVLNAAMKVYTAVQLIANGVTAAFNAILLLNPIGIVILAVAAFIAIMTALYFKFDNVRQIVDTVFQGMLAGGKAVFNGLTTYFTGVFNIFKGLFNGIAKMWNNTIGSFAFRFPDWIPGGLGGNKFSVPKIPMLAEGGIVNSPMLAMIGEKGPEAVIPLNKMNQGITININGVITEQGAGQAIVNALKRYNQTTGPISIRVA